MKKPRYLIGIDPGTKTGFAVWDRKDKKLTTVETRTIISAMQQIKWLSADEDGIELRVEDCRQRKWFGSAGRERLKGVGSVNRDCSIWDEFAQYYCIKYLMVHPKNSRTKIDAKTFKSMTNWTGRTSEHARDASMLVIGG